MSDAGSGRVRIQRIETLSDGWHPLRRLTFDYKRRDGTEQRLECEVIFTPPGAAVLPFDAQRATVLLTQQFRLPAHINGEGPALLEVCAGRIETGDDAAETVRKEAEQELGYCLRDVRKVFELYMSPASSAQKMHLFLASYDPAGRVGTGGGLAGEGEEIEVVELPLGEACRLVGTGRIVDAKTVLLLQYLLISQRCGQV